MKTKILFSLFALTLFSVSAFSQKLDKSNYRIAISSDGNAHDKDDILAAPMSHAIIAEAKMKSKFIHHDYSNHLWGDNGNQANLMRTAVNGAVSRWGTNGAKVFEVRKPNQLNAAKNNFAAEAKKARNQGYQIYYACGGPMHVPWLCVTAAPQNTRNKITVISHAVWNDTHKHGNSKTWNNLKNTGVKTIGRNVIGNQNKTYWNSSKNSWNWLKNKGGKYQWLYNRNKKSTFDASDAGMVWYIITGRGDKKAKAASVKKLFNQGNLRVESEENSAWEIPEIKVFPNPASSQLNLIGVKNLNEVRIINFQGKVVMQNIKNQTIDIAHLRPGTYFLTTDDKSIRFVKF